MNITEVNITPIKPSNGLVGFGSVVFGGCLYLGSIGIHTRRDGNGYRITYPTKKAGMKDLHIYHPISREAGQLIEAAVIARAEEILG